MEREYPSRRRLARLLYEKEEKVCLFLFPVLFLLAVLFNLWKAPFGYFSADESLYLSIPFRMLQGDRYLLHEWNMSQMSSFLILPLLRLYLLLAPNTDGIALHFRYLYVLFHSLAALYLFLALRRREPFGAMAASLFYALYSYQNIMALSYNSMGVGLMLTATVTMAVTRSRPWEYLFSGLCFAGAVLCCPFLVIVYAVYTLAVLVLRFCGAIASADLRKVLSVRGWLFFTLGCAVLALLFFLPILLSGKARLLLETLPLIVVDPAHPGESVFEWARGFVRAFVIHNSFAKPVFIGGVLLAVLMAADKKRRERGGLYLFLASGLALLFSLSFLLMYLIPNEFLFSVAILGFFSFLLCRKDAALTRLFVLMYVPGILYCFCIDMASNLGLNSITAASAVCMPASFVFLFSAARDLLRASGGERGPRRVLPRIFLGAAALVVLVLFFGLAQSRMKVCFFTEGPPALSSRFQYGAQKGLKDTPEQVDESDREYLDLSPVRGIEQGNILYWSTESRLYLEDGKPCASFSMWFRPNDGAAFLLDRLGRYWELFPEKRPDYLYIERDRWEDPDLRAALGAYAFDVQDLPRGALLTMHW